MIRIILILFYGVVIGGCHNTPVFDGQNAFHYLQKQVDFGPRNPGSIGHLNCKKWLKKELELFAPQVSYQPFTHYDPRLDTTISMANIIASFNLNAKNRIMLCAHWDTRPRADKDSEENKDKPIPGANDGASGVAVLLELAHIMSENLPPVGVDIILFDGEDYGPEGQLDEYFLGSRNFVDKIPPTYRPRYAILLDMVGDANLNLPVEYHSQSYAPHVVDKVWSKAEKLGFQAFVRDVKTAVNDDHLILNQAGIPSINIIDFNYPDAGHRFWHTLEDTPDKCSSESLRQVGQVLLEVIYSES